jgi:hypothetical protein
LLAHATAVVQLKVQSSPLCRAELRGVSIAEIEEGERLLMEGVNYEFRCYHPETPVRILAPDVAHFLNESNNMFAIDGRDPDECFMLGGRCPTPTSCDAHVDYIVDNIVDRASDLALRAAVFSDIPFLFAPGHIAFALVAIVLDSVDEGGALGGDIEDYLINRFPLKTAQEILSFSHQVSKIIRKLMACPWMELQPNRGRGKQMVALRAEELRCALTTIASLRKCGSTILKNVAAAGTHKRSRREVECTPAKLFSALKMAKVTPMGHC